MTTTTLPSPALPSSTSFSPSHMIQNQRSGSDADADFRDIHALTSPQPHAATAPGRARRSQSWETSSHRSSTLSEILGSENFTTMSREFTAMVAAGATMQPDSSTGGGGAEGANPLSRIGEDELEETNPLAIVPDSNPVLSPPLRRASASAGMEEVTVQRVKKEEVEWKITAWQTEEVARINNRIKRDDVVINGCESEQVEKAAARLKKVERKLDEKRARAMEKMQNEVAKARRKAEEKRATAEAKRGTKVAKVIELANLMRAVGRAPPKRSFF